MTHDRRVVVPKALRLPAMKYFHSSLLHPGMTRMYQTMRTSMWWPGMKTDVEEYVRTCEQCQLWKRPSKRYGKLPEKQHQATPWEEVAVALIGSYTYSDDADAPKLQRRRCTCTSARSKAI
ncbi:TPA: hypothetical protein N0F65_012497 [Lagenidium giganteum]|uniref:Integrase zinc-binding domain-containing protein n=1 Tax=Lagenidium giganteum TaxID=4803 RepID=A0AAV2YRP4_9STRA|nr:TPA: hypothetical protein N0F65_012497 [Lagenidium giganteum]